MLIRRDDINVVFLTHHNLGNCLFIPKYGDVDQNIIAVPVFEEKVFLYFQPLYTIIFHIKEAG